MTIKKHVDKDAQTSSNRSEAVIHTGDLERGLGYSLRRALMSATKDYERIMNPLEIRPAQYAALILVRNNPGFSQSAISQALGIQRANFVSLLDELEELGWVERRSSQKDRRSFALYLTKQGETLMKRAVLVHAEAEKAMAQRLGAHDSKLLLQLLHKFADAI